MAADLRLVSKFSETAWRGFAPGMWQSRVNVRDFIKRNYTPYEGDASFLLSANKVLFNLAPHAVPRQRRDVDGGQRCQLGGAERYCDTLARRRRAVMKEANPRIAKLRSRA